MTTTAPPTPADEPQGPAERHARRFNKPLPSTEIPTTPAGWHARRYPKENR